MSRPTAMSSEDQEQIARKIGVLLLQAAPEDWQQLTVEYRATGEYHDLLGEVLAQDGSSRVWEPPEELQEIFENLRDGMYRPDVGTWLSALYIVERPSSYRIDINFDAEPHWNQPLPRAAYVDELRRYPRADEHVPDWLRAYVTGPNNAAPQSETTAEIPGTHPYAPGSDVPDPSAPLPQETPGRPEMPEQYGIPEAPPSAPAVEHPAVSAPPAAPGADHHTDVPQAPAGMPTTTGFRTAVVFDDFDEQGRPMVASRSPVSPDEGAALRQYLENAPVVLAADANEQDQLDPEQPASVPATWHTDGSWLWSGAVPFYLAQYGVPPEQNLLEHLRERRFVVPDVDDHTREAAVSALLNQPNEQPGEPSPLEAPADPRPGPDSFAASAGTPDVGAAALAPDLPSAEEVRGEEEQFGTVPATGPEPERRHGLSPDPGLDTGPSATPSASGMSEDPDNSEPESVLARLHDKLTEFGVDSAAYRIGSHNTTARCLVREGPDWIVTADDHSEGDVRFARADQAAAYLLGSLLLTGAGRVEPAPSPRVAAPQVATPNTIEEAEAPEAPEPEESASAQAPASAPFAPFTPDNTASAPEVPPRPAPEPPSANAPVAEPPAAEPPASEPPRPPAAPETETETTASAAPEPPAISALPRRTPAPPPRAAEPLQARDPAQPADPDSGEPESLQSPEGGHFLFTANQEPPPAQRPDAGDGAQTGSDAPTQFRPMPRMDRPNGTTAPPEGQQGQAPQPPPNEPGRASAQPGPGGQGSAPLPKRPERGTAGPEGGQRPPAQPGPGQAAPGQHAPGQPGPGQPGPAQPGPRPQPSQQGPGQPPGPTPGQERRPGGPSMGGQPRQGMPPSGQRPPQEPQQGTPQAPAGRDQQIQPLRGEPPLTLYRDRRHLVLQPGTELDRFGEPSGNVMYAMRTPYSQRSLPPQWASRPYFGYRVQRPVQVLRGTAVPWFEQPGGGTAYVLPAAVNELLADGTLAEVPANEAARPPME